jgi:hypothetical protein
MSNWRPLRDLAEIDSIESRLSRDRRVIVADIPGKGLCYKVVRKTNYRDRRKKLKPVY